MGKTLRSIWIVLCVLVFTGEASATTVRYADLGALVQHSDWVVYARVAEKTHPAPYATRYTLELLEVIRGDPKATVLSFTVPGGPHGALEMRIPGMPRLRAGEQTVLLLEKTPNDGLIFTGLGLGVFDVDPVARTAERTLYGAHIVDVPELFVLPAQQSLDRLLVELRRLAR